MTPEETATAIEKVLASTLLSDAVRREARQLRARLPAESAAVQRRLCEMAIEADDDGSYAPPTTDLLRVMPATTVLAKAVHESERLDPRAFLAAAEASGDPAGYFRARIRPGAVVFVRGHSWMVDAPGLLSLDSRELTRALELHDNQRPPFIVFRLTVARMRAAGVLVRPSNALDAAAAGQPQWNPEGLRLGREYLDRDVPIEAVEDLVWKP